MEQNYKYDAFISYRHLSPDKPIAEKLQKLLETYSAPNGVLKSGEKRNLHLFRDETELPTSNDLGGDILRALEQSRFLVVICSERFTESKWCMQEVAYFQKLHGGSNRQILTLLVGDPDVSPLFPDPLRYETIAVQLPDGAETFIRKEIEPLAANVSAKTLKQSLKKLKVEFLRIAAPLLGCGFDDLYQREQRRRVRRKLTIAVTAALTLAIVSIFSTVALTKISTQNKELKQKTAEILIEESKVLEESGDLYDALDSVAQALPDKEGRPALLNDAVEQAVSMTGAYKPELFTATRKIVLPDDINDMCLMNEGKSLLIITNEGASLWNTQTGEQIWALERNAGSVAYYQDKEIDSLSASEIKIGIGETTSIGANHLITTYEKDIKAEKAIKEEALFCINNEKKAISRISPDDGSVIWSVFDDYYSAPSFPLTHLTNDNGLPVHVSYKETDSDGWFSEREAISVFDFESSNKIFEINFDDLEEITESTLATFDLHYFKPYILIDYKSNVYVFKLDGKIAKYLYKIQSRSTKSGLDFELEGISVRDGKIFALWNAGYALWNDRECFCCYDASDGHQVWSFDRKTKMYGSKNFIGFLEFSDKREVAFAIIANEVFIVDIDSGKDLGSFSLGYVVEEMYYSPKGAVFVIDESGTEFWLSINAATAEDKEHFLWLNQQFNTGISMAAYCNNVYAVRRNRQNNEAIIYRLMENENKETVASDEGSFSYITVSPDQSLIAVQVDKGISMFEYERYVIIVNAEDKTTVSTIKIEEDYVESMDFLSNNTLAVSFVGGNVFIYDALSALLVEEYEKQYGEKALISRDSQEILVLSEDKNTISRHHGEKEETIFDLKEYLLKEIEEDALPYYSVKDCFISPSGNRMAIVCNYQTTADDVGVHMLVLDKMTGAISELQEMTLNSNNDLKKIVWSSSEDKLFLLMESVICGYNCPGGEKLFEQEFEIKAENLLELDHRLCCLDHKGNLRLIDPETGKDVTNHVQLLNASVSYLDDLRFIPINKRQGFLCHRGDAWLIDIKNVEIIFKVEDFIDFDADKNLIYTSFYNNVFAYPMLSAYELRQRADAILH